MINKIKLNSLLLNYNQTLKVALKKINKSGFGICFLIKNKKLFNVISDGDIRRSLLNNFKLNDKIYKIKKKKNCIYLKQNSDFLETFKKVSRFKIVPILNNQGEVIDYADQKRVKQLPQSEPVFGGNELRYLSDVIQSGWISSKGKYVDLFEKKFANFTSSKYCLSTSNGTTALQLAITSLKLKKNDEIIVPDYTFVSPINAIIHAGCKPILADVDKTSLCINLKSIKKVVTKNTKAVILVHLYGNTNELDKISNYCKNKNIRLIEDCAEAFGTTFKKTHVGNFGECGTFSFFGNKTISTGEGGMIIFKKKHQYLLAKKLRDHGMNSNTKYWHDEIGFNFRLTNLQAAIGCAQLEKAKFFVKKKIDIFKRYKKNLKDISYISFAKTEKK